MKLGLQILFGVAKFPNSTYDVAKNCRYQV